MNLSPIMTSVDLRDYTIGPDGIASINESMKLNKTVIVHVQDHLGWVSKVASSLCSNGSEFMCVCKREV